MEIRADKQGRLSADRWDLLRGRDTWLLIGGNILPLLGVLFLGWDASTLVILYWLETAILGFWLLVRLALSPKALLPGVARLAGDPRQELGGIGLALFVLAHAGIFMGVHLFILQGVMPGEWSRHLASPAAFVIEFIVPSGLWIPLLGLFLMRGVMTAAELRSGSHPGHVVVGFYARVVLLQAVILLSGMLALLIGSVIILILLVVCKTVVEIYWTAVAAHIGDALDKATADRPAK